MGYRDDRDAMALQLRELERENARLREALDSAEARAKDVQEARHEQRRSGAHKACVMCGGTLLPVAIFAGHDTRAPLPLSMSTLRFTSPEGGFTHAAPVHSSACASCGFIHNFIDIRPSGVMSAG
jgi:hypothetical protein